MKIDFFKNTNLFEATNLLFQQLGIKLNSNTAEPLKYKDVLREYANDTAAFRSVTATYFSGLIDDSVFAKVSSLRSGYSLSEALAQVDKSYEGLMFFSLELNKKPTRTEISELTRAFNRISQKMPVALLLQYEFDKVPHISIAISERLKYKQAWRQGEKAGKIIILRDIDTIDPHSGHLRILNDLVRPSGVTNYAQLHEHWLEVLDVSVLNRKFFNDLANWYLYSQQFVKFPNDRKMDEAKHSQLNLIRLITRLIFVWFLKEKGLIHGKLFEPALIKKWIKSFDANGETSKNYYPAILQNLFFATLNQRMNERDFIREGSYTDNKEQYGVKTLFRYASLFLIKEKEIKELFGDIPFMNGGLFDCLDKEEEETGKVIYVDGFSRNARKVPVVPDFLFFGEESTVNLTEQYGYKKNKEKFCGIIEIFKSYKFTIEENTPIEEEVALDPELLGKVFENLLAYYNPETETTARKQTGSFYTPREIVNYMVDESLIAYLKKEILTVSPAYLEFGKTQTQLFANEAKKGQLSFVEQLHKNPWAGKEDDLENALRHLLHYNNEPHAFNSQEVQQLIFAIDHCTILDPACGSGAFPMGVLHKLVYALGKLDPDNQQWRELQQKKAEIDIRKALTEKDKVEREKKLVEINDAFEHNASDYGRKLYLIENCIYGVDIQAIAVQISKLRFFISLIVDQKERPNADNRGIRPLPNLETKFVAANTLIGLGKPAQLGLVPTELESLENKIEQIRHRHFEAKTRKEKLQCQKEDKATRKKIAELLKSTGWHKEDADKIAGFDIYDQNLSADWFDPEWMFGSDLKQGFNIILGNPPYVSQKGVEDNPNISYNEREYYRKHYDIYKNIRAAGGTKINLFGVWTEKGLKLLKNNGEFTMIVHKNILKVASYKTLRKLILDRFAVEEIVDMKDVAFSGITAETIITRITTKKPASKLKIKVIDEGADISDLKYTVLDQGSFLENHDYIFNIYQIPFLKELAKSSQFIPLSEVVDIVAFGLDTSDNKKYFTDKQVNKKYKPAAMGRHIAKWLPKAVGYVYYDESVLTRAGKPEVYEVDEKIIMQRISSNLIACYDNQQLYCFNSTNILVNPQKGYTVKILCALLNSSFLNFYYRKTFSLDADFTVNITVGYLSNLIVPAIDDKTKKVITTVVDYILSLRSAGIETGFAERIIDALVYELYLPKVLKSAKLSVSSLLSDLPVIRYDGSTKSAGQAEKALAKLSGGGHPIGAVLQKLSKREEIALIEGQK